MNNIFYKTDEISKFFNHNRIKWDQFYESEKKIINGLNIDSSETVLDIGCACGGLGLALEEKFNITLDIEEIFSIEKIEDIYELIRKRVV